MDGGLGLIHALYIGKARLAGRLQHELFRPAAPFYRIADDRPFPVVRLSQMTALALAFIYPGQILQEFLRQLPGLLPFFRVRAFQIHLKAVIQDSSPFGCLRIAAKIGVLSQPLYQSRNHGNPVIEYDGLCRQPFLAYGFPAAVPFHPDHRGACAEIDPNHTLRRHNTIPSLSVILCFQLPQPFQRSSVPGVRDRKGLSA